MGSKRGVTDFNALLAQGDNARQLRSQGADVVQRYTEAIQSFSGQFERMKRLPDQKLVDQAITLYVNKKLIDPNLLRKAQEEEELRKQQQRQQKRQRRL